MITKYTYKEFYASFVTKKLPLQCEFCGKIFEVEKKRIQAALKGKGRNKCCFCSRTCARKSRVEKIKIECSNCHSIFERKKSDIKKSRSGLFFCSRDCYLESSINKIGKK